MITQILSAFMSGLGMRIFATPIVDQAVTPAGWNTVSHQAVGVVLGYPAIELSYRALLAMFGQTDPAETRRSVNALRIAYFLTFLFTGLGVVAGWLMLAFARQEQP